MLEGDVGVEGEVDDVVEAAHITGRHDGVGFDAEEGDGSQAVDVGAFAQVQCDGVP